MVLVLVLVFGETTMNVQCSTVQYCTVQYSTVRAYMPTLALLRVNLCLNLHLKKLWRKRRQMDLLDLKLGLCIQVSWIMMTYKYVGLM